VTRVALRKELLDALDEFPAAGEAINHQRLLQKYIRYVASQVRTGPMLQDDWRRLSSVSFTDTEWAELQRIASEVGR
jgi:hypothetical protein